MLKRQPIINDLQSTSSKPTGGFHFIVYKAFNRYFIFKRMHYLQKRWLYLNIILDWLASSYMESWSILLHHVLPILKKNGGLDYQFVLWSRKNVFHWIVFYKNSTKLMFLQLLRWHLFILNRTFLTTFPTIYVKRRNNKTMEYSFLFYINKTARQLIM